MTTVNIRELARNASKVVKAVERSGRPAFVTRHGRAAAVILPVSDEDLEDYVLANAPEFVTSMREADRAVRARRTREAFAFYDELEGSKLGDRRAARVPAKKKAPARPRSGSASRRVGASRSTGRSAAAREAS